MALLEKAPALAGPAAPPHRLSAEGLRLGYGDRVIVDELGLSIQPGRITVLVGANGCGKSTLLKGMARLLTPSHGAVLLDGKSVHATPSKEIAKVLGLLPQSPTAPEGITVADLVGRGRYPHQGWFRRWTAEDEAAVTDALTATGTLELADRPIDEMSGGQRQRVWIAMALAQQTDLLLLDEPTTFLDLAHQIDVLDLLTDLNRRRGTTIVIVMHDLNLACRYADELIAMCGGTLIAQGAPAQVITAETVREVFGIESVVINDPLSGTPTVVPVGRHHCGGRTDR
ncbi:iron complex transport system ATP-binding protein [Friedmanniella endophytica]|uniref:Iron complex transport system ATP-binding protein n=1 Tax=Microlunatus kandeliicorticis TaxID=1759536 RepID=A0A7W3IRQ4_9ACTN|nr:ABC transporter ATP-binding protein [Microlunatus kandeliicorticis]MBA8794016.1 iron complex transport system ATP-binding protein [Microlunatus kandeliicorticis]